MVISENTCIDAQTNLEQIKSKKEEQDVEDVQELDDDYKAFLEKYDRITGGQWLKQKKMRM